MNIHCHANLKYNLHMRYLNAIMNGELERIGDGTVTDCLKLLPSYSPKVLRKATESLVRFVVLMAVTVRITFLGCYTV
jgi:hypothetical protein